MIILFVLMVFLLGLPVWGIVDAATQPQASWTAIGQNQVVWILVQVFLSALGTLVYVTTTRPKLTAIHSQG